MILSSHGIIGSSIVQFNANVPAQEFFDRVTNAGGSLTSTEEDAILNLIIDLNNAGIWTKMKAIYPMVGASAAACAQNLKSSSFTGTFSSGWTFASTGVTPNGTSAIFNTGLNILNNLSLTSTHLSFYSRTNNQNSEYGSEFIENAAYDGLQVCMLRTRTSALGGTQFFSIGQDNGASVSNTSGLGFHIGVATSLTSRKIFQNNTLKATSSLLNLGSLSNTNLFIGGSAVAGQYSRNQSAFASIGDGLTDTQAGNFYTAVQAFQETLNREV
jgi:hypothetical protein